MRLNIFIHVDILVLVSELVVMAILSEWWLIFSEWWSVPTTLGTSLLSVCLLSVSYYHYDLLCRPTHTEYIQCTNQHDLYTTLHYIYIYIYIYICMTVYATNKIEINMYVRQ